MGAQLHALPQVVGLLDNGSEVSQWVSFPLFSAYNGMNKLQFL